MSAAALRLLQYGRATHVIRNHSDRYFDTYAGRRIAKLELQFLMGTLAVGRPWSHLGNRACAGIVGANIAPTIGGRYAVLSLGF